MRSLTTVCCVSWLVLVGALAIACDDDSSGGTDGGGGDGNAAGSGEPTDGGTSSMGASSNTGATSGMAGSGEGGEVGSVGGNDSGVGGETGSPGGAPTGEGGGAGAGSEPVDPNLCENFPVTVTGGPTISLGVTGAVLCLDPCRVTTNTYSDGEGACNGNQLGFFVDSGQSPSNWATVSSTWTWESASAGTINQNFSYYLDAVPSETVVTAVVSAPDQTEYTVVFSFPGNGQITITSFTEN
jgi:hypothetical protein